jgi:ATP-binding cassette subfamily B multidrug efflux pump
MFALFERYLQPTAVPTHPEPPDGLVAFLWHFAKQAKWLFVALFVVEFFVALTDSAVPWFMGRIVTLVTTISPAQFLAVTWPWLVGMALVVLVARPGIALARYLITNQAIAAPFTGLIRWQAHFHVVRQSWAFFQNDFAGRISNRVMQTGPAVRQTLVATVTAVWYVLVYGTTAVVMTASADAWLTLPIFAWSPAMSGCCGTSCHACATAPRSPRKHARPWWAASSTATPTSSPSSCSPVRAMRTTMSATPSTTTPTCSSRRSACSRCSAPC